jgi:hypothetical protein
LNKENELCSLLIFAKTPEPGQVKTRIAQTVGPEKAAEIYAEMLDHILGETAAEGQWERILFITPESDEDYFHRRGLKTRRQKGNGIGERIANALIDSASQGNGKIVLIGSDIPELTSADIAAAFEMLASFPAVIGPSADGGFYLFGLAAQYVPQAAEVLQQPIRWSTPEVLAEVERQCRAHRLRLGYLPVKNDIDTYEDWICYQEAQR